MFSRPLIGKIGSGCAAVILGFCGIEGGSFWNEPRNESILGGEAMCKII
jgi:hypothetical protein